MPKIAPSTPINSTNQSPSIATTISRTRRAARGLRSAAPARATAGAGTRAALQAGDQPAPRRVGQFQADAVAAFAVADQNQEVGPFAADAVALQQLNPCAPATLGRRDTRARTGELSAQLGRRGTDATRRAAAVAERQVAGQEPA